MEYWKDIPGYVGKYQVSNMGRVKSIERVINSKNQFIEFKHTSKERVLAPGRSDKCGHTSVVLNDPRKKYMVHKLVMLAFVGPIPNGMCVCHNNGISYDNRLCNLRYDTQHENVIDVYRLGRAWRSLTIDDVEAIRFGLWCGISCSELGRMFGVAHQTISKIKTGRTYSWL